MLITVNGELGCRLVFLGIDRGYSSGWRWEGGGIQGADHGVVPMQWPCHGSEGQHGNSSDGYYYCNGRKQCVDVHFYYYWREDDDKSEFLPAGDRLPETCVHY